MDLYHVPALMHIAQSGETTKTTIEKQNGINNIKVQLID